MSLLDEIKNDAEGVLLLKDWLGQGFNHVTPQKAAHRSLACLHGDNGMECPHHKMARWWETAKHKVADVIKKQLQLKSRFKLATPFDDKMKICAICRCCMALKIWTPIEHVRKHTSKDTESKLPPHCWIRKELAEHA